MPTPDEQHDEEQEGERAREQRQQHEHREEPQPAALHRGRGRAARGRRRARTGRPPRGRSRPRARRTSGSKAGRPAPTARQTSSVKAQRRGADRREGQRLDPEHHRQRVVDEAVGDERVAPGVPEVVPEHEAVVQRGASAGRRAQRGRRRVGRPRGAPPRSCRRRGGHGRLAREDAAVARDHRGSLRSAGDRRAAGTGLRGAAQAP